MPRAQSSIEYITTYAWAIVIIVVVVAALYSVGVFNLGNIAAKAQPGACQVYRPYGPGTIQLLSLQGVCTNGAPKFVAYFNGGSGISAASLSTLQNNNGPFTISVWMSPTAQGLSAYETAVSDEVYSTNGFRFGNEGGSLAFWTAQSGGTINIYTAASGANKWYNLIVVYANQKATLYVNGANVVSGTGTYIGTSTPIPFNIGTGGGTNFYGSIADVQVYNTSLNANQVSVLYQEGIGGDPTILQNLVAWWPLNGDFNDYSGNNNNGAGSSITFSSAWATYYNNP
jgi:hypothetical protein